MAKITDAPTLDGIWIGSKWNEKRAILSVPAGGAEEAGLLFLESVDGSGDLQDGLYLWADSAGKLRYSSSRPTDEDFDGDALDNTTIGAAANKTLSNLASVAVNCDIVSDTDSTDDLGSSTVYWAETYTDKLYLSATSYMTAGVFDGGNYAFGVTGTGRDVTFYGDDYDLVWDCSEDELILKDNAKLVIGTGSDVELSWDATDMEITFAAANSVVNFGQTNTSDLVLHGSTAGSDIYWDASGDVIYAKDDTHIGFGDAIDMYINFNATNLEIRQTASGTGGFLIGVDNKGIDTTFFAETSGDYIKWDQDGSTNVGALTFVDSSILFDQTNVDYTLVASVDALSLTATDHASAAFTLGATGTHGMNTIFQGQASGDTVTFDAGAGTWTYGDVQTVYTGVDSSGTLLAITGIDTTGNTDTVTIDHSGTGAALYIDLNGATSLGIELEAYTNQTVSGLVLDGTTAGWYGANDVGFLHIKNDITHANAGASLFYITESGTPVASAEGFLARFIHTGTATATAHAIDIEVPATQPAMSMNGALDITGQGASNDVALTVVGNDGTNNTVAVDIHNEGTGAALQITSDDVDTPAIKCVAKASQTHSSIIVDGETTDWIGAADNTGMVHLIHGSTALAHAGGTMLYVASSAQQKAAAEGTCARFLCTGTARADATVVEIAGKDDTEEALNVSSGYSTFAHKATFSAGQQSSAVSVVASADGTGAGTVPDGAAHCTVTVATNADDIVILPTPTPGTVVWLHSGAVAYELRSSAPSTVLINAATGGAAVESTVLNTDYTTRCVCIDATHWIATHWTSAGVDTPADGPT